MPSVFSHAVVGMTAAQFSPKAAKRTRLFLSLSILCSVFPDVDGILLIAGVPYDSFFGHRGFFHSILVSCCVGWIASSIFLKRFPFQKIKQDWPVVFYFSLVTLSHPLLDALTQGGHGVALFSPFNIHRYFYNYRPIYASPFTLSEFFNSTGIRVVFRELLFVILPCGLLLFLKKLETKFSLKWQPGFNRVFALLTTGLIVVSFGLPRCLIREELIPGINGVDVHKIDTSFLWDKANGIGNLPTADLPEKKIVVNYKDLVKYNLLNTVLTPRRLPWAGSFFPTWLGGISGSWQEPEWIRIWKTLVGTHFPDKKYLADLLYTSDKNLQKLAPTVKYDLALGDYYLTSSRYEDSRRGRGLIDAFPTTPFWAGYCNAISLAAIYEKEPQYPVTALNPDGYEILFYPNDIKALLGVSYMFVYPKSWDLGVRCELDGPKSEACLDINPASFVIALTNMIGLAKTTFLIDKEPFVGIQNAPIRSAEIKIVNPPYFVHDRENYFKIEDPGVKWLTDVEIHLALSEITPLEPTRVENTLVYRATLALDSEMNLIGGRWEDPFQHPDFAWGGGSVLTEPGRRDDQLLANRAIEWPVVRALLEQSTLPPEKSLPVLISQVTRNPVSHGFAFRSEVDGIRGGISYLKWSAPAEVYGRVEGENLASFKSIDWVELKGSPRHEAPGSPRLDEGPNSKEVILASVELSGSLKKQQFFKMKIPESVQGRENLLLRLNRKEPVGTSIQFEFPSRQSFERPLDKVGVEP